MRNIARCVVCALCDWMFGGTCNIGKGANAKRGCSSRVQSLVRYMTFVRILPSAEHIGVTAFKSSY